MSIEKESHKAHSGWYAIQYATAEAQKEAIERRLLERADNSSPVFRKLKRKIAFHDFLVKASLMPSQVLCAVIFKKMPSTDVQQAMKEEGFAFYVFPPNPYS